MEPTPDAPRAVRAWGARRRRRGVGAALLTALIVLSSAPSASAQVTRADIGDAEADVGTAVERLRAAQGERAEAVRQRDRLAESLERVADRIAARERDLVTDRQEALARIAICDDPKATSPAATPTTIRVRTTVPSRRSARIRRFGFSEAGDIA